MNAIAPYLRYWRTIVARDREIVEAVVDPAHLGPSPALRSALHEWQGVHYWGSGPEADRLVLVRTVAPPQRERWWLHGLLFLGTFITVWMGGALLLGVSTTTFPNIDGGLREIVGDALGWAQASVGGLPFAMALMGILLSHEMGHYFAARRYGINASPPYFLPAPIEFNFIGTFGAFIRLRSPVVDRRQLMDVGAAGPWAGFVVALLMLIVGFQGSYIFPGGDHLGASMIVETARGDLLVGDSLLTLVLRTAVVGDGTIVLHPLAVAGWIGMLVTALNLLPLGQLDGGHVLYALLGDRQRVLGLLTWAGLLVLGRWFWPWWIWAALTLLLGGGRLGHPRVLERHRPLPGNRWPLGWASVVLFAVTFTPIPIII